MGVHGNRSYFTFSNTLERQRKQTHAQINYTKREKNPSERLLFLKNDRMLRASYLKKKYTTNFVHPFAGIA